VGGWGGGGNWFQNYQPVFYVDRNNTIHFVVAGNTDIAYQSGPNTLIYAKSSDGGKTWQRANGSQITGFPIRGIPNLPNSGDIVANTKTIDGSTSLDLTKSFGAPLGISVDKKGVVGISTIDTINPPGAAEIDSFALRTWNGSQWIKNTSVLTTNSVLTSFTTPDANLIFTSTNSWNFSRANDFGATFYTTPISIPNLTDKYDTLVSVDQYGLRTTGVIYGLMNKPGDNGNFKQYIIKISINPDPCIGAGINLCK
jgi:hypothetical protein